MESRGLLLTEVGEKQEQCVLCITIASGTPAQDVISTSGPETHTRQKHCIQGIKSSISNS